MINQVRLAKKIKKIREDLGLNQENFAKAIGLSRVAVSQLESGKRGLDALELFKIANALGVSVDFLLQEKDQVKIYRKTTEDIKKYKVYVEKLKNVILYILNKCGGKPNIGETVFYKLLYFLDFDHYELYGCPITGLNYKKLQFGPVPCPDDYNSIVNEMIKDKQLQIITQDYHGMIQKRYIACNNYNINNFKPSELKVIDDVIAHLSDMNANQIENYVHDDIPWKESKDKEIIDYDLVSHRSPKYSKRDYDWEMQNVAADDYLKKEPMSEEEYNYYENK